MAAMVSVEVQEPHMMNGLDLREMTFQNVVDNILRPSGIKIGGFPEELFLNLTEQERQHMMCNICFLIANDCRLCDNDHVFCHSCIVAWSMTFGENAHKCPVCRCGQIEYSESEELKSRIGSKQVRCLEEGCCFQSTLAEYLHHEHGKAAYCNAHVDFSCLKQQLIRPSSVTDNTSQAALPTSLRSQLLQSRTMIQQMMMLMRIEMQLRQQALFNYQQSQDPESERAPGLDDALALNSQLSEISSVLATLIRSTSLGQRSGRRRPSHRELAGAQRLRRADGFGFARSAALRRLGNISTRQWREIDIGEDSSTTDDNDDDDSGDDEVLDMNSSAPVNNIDDFIWQQLNADNTEGHLVDTVRSSPDGMSTISSLPDVQSVSSIQSIPSIPSLTSIQSLPSISAAPSNQSVHSGISNVTSYASLVSPSISYEGRQLTPQCVLCMDNCQHPAAEGQCLCEVCGAFDSIAVGNVDAEDDVVLQSHHNIHSDPLLVSDGTFELRTQLTDTSNPSVCAESGAVVSDSRVSEALSTSDNCMPLGGQPVCAVHQTVHPVVAAGRDLPPLQTSLPAVSQQSPLTSLPGTRRAPHLNYAARLRRQTAEVTHLPSEVRIRLWPLPDPGQAAVGNLLQSSAVGNSATQIAGPSLRSSTRQLPLYNLPPLHSSVLSGNAYRGRNIRPSRYNSSVSGDHVRTPRP